MYMLYIYYNIYSQFFNELSFTYTQGKTKVTKKFIL